MQSGPAIVHLIGFPGAGKYTVARAIAEQARQEGDHYVVVDNHHTSNVIFSVMEVDGVRRVPETVWDRVDEVREAVYRTIEELSPPEWSFVFTNVLTDDKPQDHAAVERLSRVAASRGCPYVPVRVRCDLDELLRRVPSTDRRERMKWIDPDAVRDFATPRRLVDLDRYGPLDLDVTSIPPDEAARRVLRHIAVLASTTSNNRSR